MLHKIFLILALFPFLFSCQSPQQERSTYLLGTYIRISSRDTLFTPTLWESITAVIGDIDQKMNAHIAYPKSELFKLKAQAGKAPLTLSSDTYHLIERAIDIAHISEGAFNPAIQPLVTLWGFGGQVPQLPEDAHIQSLLPLLDYRRIRLLPPFDVLLEEEGMGVDLGGIAKGYAAELAAQILREAGVSHALLDFGGNIVTMGEKPSGEPWHIGLRNPFGSAMEIFGVLESQPEVSVITSGAYERFFIVGNMRYHHIFDHRSGYPAHSDLASVTIVSTDGVAADAFSTAGFVMGLSKAKELINSQEEIEGVLVDNEKGVWVSPALQHYFSLKNVQFTLKSW